MKTLDERIKTSIILYLNVKEEEVIPKAILRDDLGADSLDVIELVMELEDQFGIDIPDDDIKKHCNVQNIIDYIKKKVQEKNE